jgi:hypothetical protein
MAKPLFSIFICPNQCQRNTVAHQRAAVRRNQGVDHAGVAAKGFIVEQASGAMHD